MRKLVKALFTLCMAQYFFFIIMSPHLSFAEETSIVKPPKSAEMIKSTDCGSSDCHKRILKEWSNTMHANSSPAKDPVVKAFYDYLSKENYDTSKCDKCHVPIRAIYAEEKRNGTELFDEGVNCILCHSIYGKNHGQKQGIDFYKLNFLKSVTGPTKSGQAAHVTEFIGMFRNVDICAGCHQNGETDYYLEGKSQLPCQQCHMPSKRKLKSAVMGKVRDKVYRHLFEGGHSELLLSMAAIIEGEARKEGKKTVLNISVENSALHPLPTGFPLRAIYMKITALDENDAPIWNNYKEDPQTEDPKSYFASSFPKEEAMYVHCVKDIKPLSDTRFPSKATKKFSYEVASEKVATFQVQLFYRLLPKAVVKKLNIDTTMVPETLMVEETIYVD